MFYVITEFEYVFIQSSGGFMQIVICDDVAEERQTLRENICSCGNELSLDYVIEEFESAEDLLTAVRNGGLYPDILFMDIYMKGMTGVDAVRLLFAEGFSGSVIFITTSKSHAIESYELMADGYLVKPYSADSFRRNFQRAAQGYAKSFKTISFTCDRLEFRVFLKDLEYIQSHERGSILYVRGEALKTSKSVSTFARELYAEDNFLRTHQSCIVNLNFVEKVEEDFVRMKSGAKAPLTLRNRQTVRKSATDYFFLKMRED